MTSGARASLDVTSSVTASLDVTSSVTGSLEVTLAPYPLKGCGVNVRFDIRGFSTQCGKKVFFAENTQCTDESLFLSLLSSLNPKAE
ncbi:hypothetical protein BaRGS_00039815 [Batillaria attramentaria]|uniref:Uncharacterized protein n=1 Tax=Batillaria attramentaria TaxID=370345 RepID=A0ABD0J246_9CAEN